MNKNQQGFTILPLVIFLGIVICIVFIGVGIQKKNAAQTVKSTSGSTQASAAPAPTQTRPYPATTNWEEVKLTDPDYKRKKDIELFGFDVLAYSLNHHNMYPANAAEAATTQEKDPLLDPDTKQPYVVVDTTPELGQIQYKLSMTCDTYNRNYEPLDSPSNNIYAMLMKMSEGSYICKSNIK